jgi:GNAT superfamily N-acetyltransferase
MNFRVRAATIDDAAAIYDVWYKTEFDGEPAAPPPHGPLELHRHEIRTGSMFVAEDERGIAGFAASVARGSFRFLSELFVLPDRQSAGIATALLAEVLPQDGLPIATFASDNFAAQAIYVRSGMAPRWPLYYLASEGDLDLPGTGSMKASVGSIDDELLGADRVVSGLDRRGDLGFLVDTYDGAAVRLHADGRLAGYGIIRRRNDESIDLPGAAWIGPAGALDSADAADCLLALASTAHELSPVIIIAVPGPHAALPALLKAGFRIADQDTFMCSAPADPADATRYVPISGSFF